MTPPECYVFFAECGCAVAQITTRQMPRPALAAVMAALTKAGYLMETMSEIAAHEIAWLNTCPHEARQLPLTPTPQPAQIAPPDNGHTDVTMNEIAHVTTAELTDLARSLIAHGFTLTRIR